MKVRNKVLRESDVVYCSEVLDRPPPRAFRFLICKIEILVGQI